jgi:hypothetical protein
LNKAGSSLMPIPVSDALHAYLHQEEQSGGYETAVAQAANYRAWQQCDSCIIATPSRKLIA